ncbi:MAG: sialate O-acetylesterase [Planctomycetes bacterium]|nr:sialate O-acetylesterase [Planctomycetota bacterium]
MHRISPLLIALAVGQLAAVELSPMFNDNAVLQRDREVAVWGGGKPGEQITVRFAGQERQATADADGRWLVRLAPLAASKEGRDLVVAGEGTVTVKNVVVGEVWICSGQSNMEWVVNNTMNSKDEIAAAELPLIRQLDIPNLHRGSPTTTFKAAWTPASPKTAGGFTAVGFYFAREIARELDVPIGLIASNWGGTRIEPWISPAGLRASPELKDIASQVDATDPSTDAGNKAHLDHLAKVREWLPQAEAALAQRKPAPALPAAPGSTGDQQGPARLWNGMIAPLVPYGIRGALWYQGESNGGEGVSYLHKKKALVSSWRQAFGQGDFPFYFVQLANYQKSDPAKPEGGDGWSRLREAQLNAIKEIPATGMAVTIDIGEANDIHPRNKQDVGRRLALWAMAKDYGKPVVHSGPLYASQAIEGAAIRVRFDSVGGGLMAGTKKGLEPVAESKGAALTWWAIAGEDKVWRKAEARIDGDSVVVSSPEVAKPVAVRYAFAMNPEGANLYNREGLPASPFRTDSW